VPGGEQRGDDGPRDRFIRYRRTREPRLRDELVIEHRGLADALARRYADRGEPLDDLRQVATLGLLRAVERFDPHAGHAFSSFAVPTILGELRRHFRDHGWAVHVPRRLQELQREVEMVRRRLEQRLARVPTVAEIAGEIGTSTDDVVQAMDAGRSYTAVPLESPFATTAASPDEYTSVDDRLVVHAAVRDLDDRELALLRMRFVEERSQSEIGARIGVSQVHVSRLLRRTLHKLAAVMEPH
jgi:RNA polymerase sigma-B factor